MKSELFSSEFDAGNSTPSRTPTPRVVMTQYVKICEDESGSGAVEVPSELDGTLLLSTIQAQCPGACGLRYKYEESNSWRGVRLADNVLYPPFEDGWANVQYIVVPSKTG